MKKSEVRQMIKEEIEKLKESNGKYSSLDGQAVIYHGTGKYSGKKGTAHVDNGKITIFFKGAKSKVNVDAQDLQLVEGKFVGHYSVDGKITYVDSNFINKSSGVLPNSELKHMGFGEFYIETPDGDIQFARKNDKIDGFVGRVHKIYDDANGKLVKKLIATMLKNKKIELV